MAKNPNSKAKLVYLAQILRAGTDEQQGMSMAQLLAALSSRGVNAERKSVYADIELLRAAGMDIELVGREYRLMSREFEPVELRMLADAVCASRFISLKKSRELLKKLGSLASERQSLELRRSVHVDNRVKTMNESVYYNTDALHAAINSAQKAQFRYFDYSADGKSLFRRDGGRYTVSFAGLIFRDDNYYAVGIDDATGTVRNYRVDRMSDVSVTDEPAAAAAVDLDVSEYAAAQFSMFGGERVLVELVFDDSLRNVVIDRFGKDVMMRPRGEGSFAVAADIAVSDVFFGWLLQFGTGVRIVSPAAVAARYAALLDSVSGLYAAEN